MDSRSAQRGGYCSHSWKSSGRSARVMLAPISQPPHSTLLRLNLIMDWGTLVCTKGMAPCNFSTCTTTLSTSAGTPSFRLKPSVEFWPYKEEGQWKNMAGESGKVHSPLCHTSQGQAHPQVLLITSGLHNASAGPKRPGHELAAGMEGKKSLTPWEVPCN